MSIQPISLDGTFATGKKSDNAPQTPANDNDRHLGRERFPKVDDIVDRLTNKTPVTDGRNG